ncbi:hypothetical protein H2199_001119 [Coniosporium tulheliwenetii]|uniref:Uncharacterized protein n=1 Tax=Coniosporium tulheliwenetii TaxID=3383036 RepID=A0ACC2ZLD5_9PEZI|nr:hypothetical protein H2199_001119 [Cladosporium sp. JES 115]
MASLNVFKAPRPPLHQAHDRLHTQRVLRSPTRGRRQPQRGCDRDGRVSRVLCCERERSEEYWVDRGCKWCLCASRWKEAMDAANGVDDKKVPKIILSATNEKALQKLSLDDLKKYAVDKDA